MASEDPLTRPSKLELYESELGGSSWLSFIGLLVIVAGLIDFIV